MVCDIQLPMNSIFLDNVKFLGFVLDEKASLSRQVSSVCAGCCYFIRKIYSIRDSNPKYSWINLMRVQILTRLDYCNLLYYGLPEFLLQKLQPIMNFACKLIVRLSPGTLTLDFIKQLHWLSVRKRILFKTLRTGHRLVHDPQMVPHYLKSLVSRNGKVKRSHFNYNFQTPALKTTFGQRSFSFVVPHDWNWLLFKIKLLRNENAFREKCKSSFF